MSGKLRRALVQQLRDEGRAAFDAGKGRGANPHKYADEGQWLQGWEDRNAEFHRNAAREAKETGREALAAALLKPQSGEADYYEVADLLIEMFGGSG